MYVLMYSGGFLGRRRGYVGSIEDRPVEHHQDARKFTLPADAECYKQGRPHLGGARLVDLRCVTTCRGEVVNP